MTELEQVQAIADNLQVLADRLSTEGRPLDAVQAVGGVQTIRMLWAKLHPPAPAPEREPKNEVAITPGSPERARINPDGTAWVGRPPEPSDDEPNGEPPPRPRLEAVD